MPNDQLHLDQGKKSSYDLVGPILATTTAILAIIVVALHVYLVSRGKADGASTLMLNILALTFSTVCTIWVGRWSALRENKSFIRAALRTTYGLYEGLEAAEQSAVDGINRMKNRAALSTQVSSDFWEECFGRVIEQLRNLMRGAKQTIANWHEFGPEEIERFRFAEKTKAEAVTELATTADEMRGILRDLKAFPGIANTSALRQGINAIEHEKARITSSSALSFPSAGDARKLLVLGAFEEAVNAYTALLQASPGSHTLLVGRARARHLAGDSEGALRDLESAEKLCSTDLSIQRLRSDIEAGRRTPIPSSFLQAEFRAHVARGNNALAAGNGEEALKHYTQARRSGLMNVFAAQDEAMALILLKKYDEAQQMIESAWPQITGPFMKLQTSALRVLIRELKGEPADKEYGELSDCLKDMQRLGMHFEISESPLQYLITGLSHAGLFSKPLQELFNSLKGCPLAEPESNVEQPGDVRV